MNCLGLDVGGANLKAADGRGWACSVPFPLWRDPNGLSGALAALLECAPSADTIAVTMTGELCDAFRTKADGVFHILEAVEQVAAKREVTVYLVDGRLATLEEARRSPQLAAASNWHALARFVRRYLSGGAGLLVDVGSTTTDIIPIVAGQVAARGMSDSERLVNRELVYSGVGRTPICAVVQSLPFRGQDCRVAAELFATTADAYVLLAELDEEPEATWTSDGRPLTIEFSKQRLARMLCADAGEMEPGDFERIATAVRDAQLRELKSSIASVIDRMPELPSSVIVSGSGEFLARYTAECAVPGGVISLAKDLGPLVSRCAPAHALAVLTQVAGEIVQKGPKIT